MESANLTSRTIEIDGMNGDACVQKVTAALKGVPNVKTGSVKVGSATIHADKAGCDAACNAINSAGYKAHLAADANQGAAKDGKAESTQTKPGANVNASQQQGQGAGRNAGEHNNAGKPAIGNAGSPAKATEAKGETAATKRV